MQMTSSNQAGKNLMFERDVKERHENNTLLMLQNSAQVAKAIYPLDPGIVMNVEKLHCMLQRSKATTKV